MSGAGAFSDLTDSYLDLRWHFDPVDASAAGVHAHDERLGAFATEDVRQHVVALRAIMGALEEVEVDDLQDEIDRTALLNEMRFTVRRFGQETPHTRDPGFWLSHVFEGLYVMLAARDRDRGNRARAAAARLRGIPTFLERARETLERCPSVFVDTGREVTRGGRVLVDEIATSLRPDDDPEFDDACTAARAALDDFADHLDAALASEATDDFAIGVDQFDFRLRFQHALPGTASELARYGAALVEDVEADLARLGAEIQPGVAWPDVVDRLRDDHPESADLVPAYAAEMSRAREFVRELDLAPIPDGRLDVIPTPSFLRPLVPFAAYQPPGAFSSDRTGWFYVSLPDGNDGAEALRDHCTYEIPSTALHEGYPGHHLQFLNAHAQSRTVRRLLGTPVTIEGWALYCEEMMGEEGFYRSVEEQFFQRVALLWRALRVVLDVGLHTGTIGFVDAVRMLRERMRFSLSHAEAEVRRYCAQPAYQLAYAVGRRELRALRDDFRAAAGVDYTLRGFHDAVLEYCGLPVSLMRWGLGLQD